jgi:hypothetical protein
MTNATLSAKSENLQIKLSLNNGLNDIWCFLIEEYKGLDKASIVKLALNNLAKQNYKKRYIDYDEPNHQELLLQASKTFNVSSKFSDDDINGSSDFWFE